MKRKTIEELMEIVENVYGKDFILIKTVETRTSDKHELLWDNTIFKNNKTKERVEISFTDFEDIGYMTQEYNELGDTPSNCERWNELDKRLGVEEL